MYKIEKSDGALSECNIKNNTYDINQGLPFSFFYNDNFF